MADEQDLAELLGAMSRGDRGAAAQLYKALGSRLYGIAYRILRDPGLAEDAVQESFVKIWKNAERFDPAKGSAATWMAVITRRTALDRRPRAGHVALGEFEAPSFDLDYVHPRLRECLEQLPQAHRNALVLMYVYGLTHSELAAALGAPLGTVKSWVRRASVALKESLER
jgi:RNA polymerase sigma-70 factor (ECF subfamily)